MVDADLGGDDVRSGPEDADVLVQRRAEGVEVTRAPMACRHHATAVRRRAEEDPCVWRVGLHKGQQLVGDIGLRAREAAPAGKVTLVEFSDFACTFCRQSVAEVDALIAANPDLRVVLREMPILSPASADAARWGQGNPTGDEPGTRARARGALLIPGSHLDVVST